MKDPIVEEIRKYRMEHTKKFGGDLHAICEDLRRTQETCGHEVVSFPPKLRNPPQKQDVDPQGGND